LAKAKNPSRSLQKSSASADVSPFEWAGAIGAPPTGWVRGPGGGGEFGKSWLKYWDKETSTVPQFPAIRSSVGGRAALLAWRVLGAGVPPHCSRRNGQFHRLRARAACSETLCSAYRFLICRRKMQRKGGRAEALSSLARPYARARDQDVSLSRSVLPASALKPRPSEDRAKFRRADRNPRKILDWLNAPPAIPSSHMPTPAREKSSLTPTRFPGCVTPGWPSRGARLAGPGKR